MLFTVPVCQETPVLLRHFLRSQGLSLTQWRKAKTAGVLLVNNRPAAPSTLVIAGDKISIILPVETSIVPMDIPLSIVYEDAHVLIVDKPAGLLIHPTTDRLARSLANAVMYYYVESSQHLGFHPVLRLDKNTSGLVLIAKQPYIQHLLSKRADLISKRYLALISGCPQSSEGLIDAPIARHPNSIIERVVDSSGQRALTKYHILQSYQDASLAEIELCTGRTHQIRVHFSYIGHPLLGDDLYGGPTALIHRQALHAASLCFKHPVSGLSVKVSSPLPADLKNVILSLTDKEEISF